MHISGTTLVNLGQISDIPSLCLRGTCACYLLSHLTKAYIRHNPQTTNLILLTFATLHNTVLVVNILILIVEKEFTIKKMTQSGINVQGRVPSSRENSVEGETSPIIPLPPSVIFRWRSSSIEGRLPSKVVFHHKSSSIISCVTHLCLYLACHWGTTVQF